MKKLNENDIFATTNEFYSHFSEIDLTAVTDGIHFICSESRNKEVQGFGCKYSVYALAKDNAVIVTYAPQYKAFFAGLKKAGTNDILNAMETSFRIKKMQLMIFRRELVAAYGNARLLTAADYPLYEAFFRQTRPTADPTGWLRDYFEEKTAKGYFSGYFVNGALTSVCDAPDMPFMTDRIQHTGIITLPNERRKGYARCTAALATHHLLENGICPQWECRAENAASIALACTLGYETYGTAYIVEE